ncbi:hypothetical protein, partial [Spongiibacter sp.]|uniref:hypothetical protein n=1 Tax=Spongiibacter sp. TaxID=2024860 RepID=UPI002580E8FA
NELNQAKPFVRDFSNILPTCFYIIEFAHRIPRISSVVFIVVPAFRVQRVESMKKPISSTARITACFIGPAPATICHNPPRHH